MEMRKHVSGQGGWSVRDYLTDFDDNAWLEIIQNFRVTNENDMRQDVSASDFNRKRLFGHLSNDEIKALKAEFPSLEEKQLLEATSEEEKYLKNKTLDTDLTKNLRSFNIIKLNNKFTIEVV